MRPTAFGARGLAFHAAMVAAFWLTPYSNLFFLLLGFLTLLCVVGVVGARRNLAGIECTAIELEPVPSGLASTRTVELSAAMRARFGVSVRVELEGGSALVGHVPVLAGRGELRLALPALPRGCHPVASARLESLHPFGLVRVFREVAAPREVVVYPAPATIADDTPAAAALDELLGRGRPGEGEVQPSGLRDHREGEGTRGVNWRASARRGRLVVQEWDGGTGHGLELVLDRRCDPDQLETALRTISAVVEHARTSKETLKLHTQGRSASFGDGAEPWSEVLRLLADARPLPPTAGAPPSVSPAVARLPHPRIVA